MSASPVFFVTPRHAVINSGGSANTDKTLATANNLVTAISGVAAGSIIERVVLVQNGTGASTTSNIARFFIHDGTNFALVHEVNLGATVTPNTTTIGIRITVPELVGIKLPSASHSLRVGFSFAAAGDTFAITAQVADA